MSNYKNAVKLIKELLPNKQNVVSLSVPLLEVLDDDFAECAIFSQCVYWNERTDDEDGWFYKSYQDWHKECRVKERTCRRKLENLKERGWIQTEVRQDYRSQNQLYVRVCGDKWIEDLLTYFCTKECDPADKMTGGERGCGQNDRGVRSDLPEGADKMTVSSICTKNTSEITSETTLSCASAEKTTNGLVSSPNHPEGSDNKGPSQRESKKSQHEKEFNELVWPITFKKVGRDAALRAYLKIRKEVARTDDERDDILEAWRYVNEVTFPRKEKEDGTKKYIKMPSTWFNGRNWQDEDVQEGLHSRFVKGEDSPLQDELKMTKIQQHMEQSARVYELVFGGVA